MEGFVNCPKCHQQVNANDYFCPFCGYKIRSPPPSTTFGGILVLLIKTILLPPFGFIWGYRYLRQTNNKSKLIGLVVILITVVELVWGVKASVDLVDMANKQINQQFKLYGL
ncbi:MAG: zinc ribbon domain-containing protein [Candidatus Shapirobacteria bacterium]